MSTGTFVERYTYSPVELGLNGVTLAATRTSNMFGVEGTNQIMLRCKFVFSAASELQFYFEETPDLGTTWYRIVGGVTAEEVANDLVVETIRPHQVERAVTASGNFSYLIPHYYTNMRAVFTNTGGGASDTITVSIATGVIA